MARTNLENIIPIYRIGDGYAIAKDGSVTVGFILTLPEYDTLSKADFRDDGSGDGMRLYTQLEAAIKDLDEGYTFHQQDIIYYAPQDLPHYDNYLSKTVNRMYNGKRWLSNKSYMFITKQKSISIQSDYSDEAIDKIVSVIKRFRAALSILPKAHGRQGLVGIPPGLLLHAGTMRPRPLVSRSKIRKLQDGRHRSSRRSAHQITSG